MRLELMEDSAPLYGSRSFSACEILSLKSVEFGFGRVLRFWPKRCCDGCGSYVEVQPLPHETHLWHEADWYGLWRIRLSRLAAVKSKPEQLPHETQRLRLRERWQQHFYVVKSKQEQPHDEAFHETLRRVIRAIERKQAELPYETQCSGLKGSVQHYDAVSDKSKQDERSHETQRARRFLWGVDHVSDWQGQEERPHELLIQQIRDVIAEFDTINHNHKTATKSVLTNGHGWKYVSAYDTMAAGGTQKQTAIGSYLCFPVNQHSKCNNNYSQSPPIYANQKAEDPWKENREEDKDPNGGTTVVTIRDEDQKSGHSYHSSFASAQFSTLAISSLLLCLMVLFPNFAQKNQAITAAALMGATLGSLVSLETILKCPNLARSCGYFAIISLLVAIGSLLSTSINWVTI